MGRGGKRKSDKPRNCVCSFCGKTFISCGIGAKPKYCSGDCNAAEKLSKRGIEHICQQCGKAFVSVNQKAKFCSKACAGQARAKETHYRTKHIKVCPVCNKSFETINKSQLCCSPECGRILGNEKKKKYNTCQHCGERFWRENAYRMKYCSPECQKAAIRELTIERHKDDPLPVLYKRVCPECGSEFDTLYPNHIYCSDACGYQGNLRMKREQWAAEYVPRTFICKECGAEVTTSCGDTRSTFCSDKCMERFTGREGKEKRKALMKALFVKPVRFKEVYKKANGVCQICGLSVAYDKSPEKIWAATIDHFLPLSLGGTHEPDNCQLTHRLCNSLKLQEAEGFSINWNEMLENDFDRWSLALEEYSEYMESYR